MKPKTTAWSTLQSTREMHFREITSGLWMSTMRCDAARDATDPKIRPKSRLHRTYAITFNQTVCCLQAAVCQCGHWTHDLTAFDCVWVPSLALSLSFSLSLSLFMLFSFSIHSLLTYRAFARLWLIVSTNNSWRNYSASEDTHYISVTQLQKGCNLKFS